MSPRIDAADKASGRTTYTADVALPGMCHAALVRSPVAHARIARVEVGKARSSPGVVGVFTADDVSTRTFGRRVRDIPILAREKVRFIGEGVAAVVAETREQAEEAALLVDVDYEELPAAFDPQQAVGAGAPLVHEAPWDYPRSAISEDDGHNLQSRLHAGDAKAVEDVLAGAAHVVDRTFTTPAGHAGYIEPQVSIASVQEDGAIHIWASDKTPYRIREELASCLGMDEGAVVVQPVAIGGDFGGKGLIGGVPLCAELARLTGRPVRVALRYSEDLTATNPRHSASMRVRLACDAEGMLQAMRFDALVDGGAYAGFKPRPGADLHGLADAGSPYRIPAVYNEARIAYTNTVPRGHTRAPGSPQTTFAVESALDELAIEAGLSPVEIRKRNLLREGDHNVHGIAWAEARGRETLETALEAASPAPTPPDGWLAGTGVGIYDRPTTKMVRTSLRLVEQDNGRLRAEVPVPETGTGSHTLVREVLAKGLGLDPRAIDVVHVATAALPYDRGAGGSRVTVSLGRAVADAVAAWRERGDADSVTVEVDDDLGEDVTSYCVEVANVAVDPETGVVRVLQLVTAVDVAEVINPAAHRMQVDGGTAMGYGFACLEDLHLEEGQVWAGNLGEFKLPSIRDVPPLRTVLVTGGRGVGSLNVKSIGELTNVPTAAAIANAVADATGARVRDLPVRAEKVWAALANAEERTEQDLARGDVIEEAG